MNRSLSIDPVYLALELVCAKKWSWLPEESGKRRYVGLHSTQARAAFWLADFPIR